MGSQPSHESGLEKQEVFGLKTDGGMSPPNALITSHLAAGSRERQVSNVPILIPICKY